MFIHICHAISPFSFLFSLFPFPFSLLSLFHIPYYILPCFQTSSFLDLSPYTLVLLVFFFFQLLYDFLRPSVVFPFSVNISVRSVSQWYSLFLFLNMKESWRNDHGGVLMNSFLTEVYEISYESK